MALRAAEGQDKVATVGRKGADVDPHRVLNPRLTLRVGITGHRPNKLSDGQMQGLGAVAKALLQSISDIANRIHSESSGVFSPDTPVLRLASSLAEGADTIFAHAARECGYRLDIILPFPKEAYAEAQGFSDEARQSFDGLLVDPVPHSLLQLDNHPQQANSADAYLEAGRLMLAHADILIAVWDGMHEAGVGGTAQIVREAANAGIPIVWIRPDGTLSLMASQEQVPAAEGATPTASTVGAVQDALYALANELLAPPDSARDRHPRNGPDTRARLERFLAEPQRQHSFCSVYDLMRWALTGRSFKPRIDYAIDEGTVQAWGRFAQSARDVGQQAFADELKGSLESRWRRADNIALHYSHVYRSAYIVNFTLASIAVLTGLVSVFFWAADCSVIIKAVCVFVEVCLIGLILCVTYQGGPRRGDWHRQWLEARSVAELLRSARLLALVALTAAPRVDSGRQHETWVEWYVRSVLREVGPPTCIMNEAALRTAISSTLDVEVAGQIAYNANTVRTYRRMDHVLHAWGKSLLLFTLCAGLVYVVVSVLYSFHLLDHLVDITKKQKDFVKALVTFVGAGIPAIGAALFGIQATGDFKLAGQQAARTASALESMQLRLERELPAPKLGRTMQLLLMLTQILSSDLGDWAKIYRMRELTLPG